MHFDPRPLLNNLQTGKDLENTWHELWEELYHQGDVGEASYAVVPHLVRIHQSRGVPDWNTYAIVATIELARGQGNNPQLPEWLKKGYFQAIQELAATAVTQLPQVEDSEHLRAILSILAINKGARIYGRLLLIYSEEELLEFESSFGS